MSDIQVIMDPDGTLTLEVEQLHDPAAGVAVVTIRPGIRNASWAVCDLVASLGKPYGILDCKRSAEHAPAFAIPWLVSNEITDLVFLQSQLLPRQVLADLIHLGLVSGTRVWFVMDSQTPQDLYDFLVLWDATPVLPGEFPGLWNARPAEERSTTEMPEDGAPASFPAELPSDDFPTFYSACRQELDPAAFALVAPLYRRALQEGLDLFAEGDPTLAELSTVLCDLLSDVVSRGEALVALRGLQAAAQQHNVFLKVKRDQFLNRASEITRPAHLTDEDWGRLGDLAAPRDAALGVLAALGLTVDEIMEVHGSRAALDGSVVKTDSRTIGVPHCARRFLIAQHLFRLAVGAPPDGPFICGDNAMVATPTKQSMGVYHILKVSRLTGLALKTGRRTGARSHSFGLSIHFLPA